MVYFVDISEKKVPKDNQIVRIKIPQNLKAGDTIGIVATARKMDKTLLDSSIRHFMDWGLNVKIGKTLDLEHHQFAGTDAERREDFQNMIDDHEIQAILCARGGYGTIRIVDGLDWSQFKKRPKWIAGYSDITVVHSFLNRKLKIASLHCTMPISEPSNTEDAMETMRKAFFGERLHYETKADEHNRLGSAEGSLVGGNLSILYSLTGSEADIKTKGKILLIEDLDEYLYHVDRMMMNLKRSGKLDKLKGLIIGGMNDMKDNEIPFGHQARQIIREHVEDYDYPVCFNFPSGHIRDNRAVILGKKAKLTVLQHEGQFVQ